MYLAMVSITEHKIYLVEAVSICSMKLQKKQLQDKFYLSVFLLMKQKKKIHYGIAVQTFGAD
jgi:hypothetical protein